MSTVEETRALLDSLPEVTFADSDPAPILARMTASWEKDMDKTLYPADPERQLLNTVAYVLSVVLAKLDFTGKQNLPKYAQDEFADQLSSFFQVERLRPSPAVCTQRFYAESDLDFAVAVPAGTRVSPDGQLFYALDQALSIPPQSAFPDGEQPWAEGRVACLTPGLAGNGFAVGQVNQLVDTVPNLAATENTEISQGGADEESSDRLMSRAILAPEAASTAGPEGAYRSLVLGVSQSIADVAVLSPVPCEIELYPLLTGGELPGEAMLAAVAESVSPRDVRPQGDLVRVLAPQLKEYTLQGKYYISNRRKPEAAAIQAAVAEAVTAYSVWQSAVLGRDINPEELSCRARAAGAKRLELALPIFTVVAANEVARATELSLEFGGFEDD